MNDPIESRLRTALSSMDEVNVADPVTVAAATAQKSHRLQQRPRAIAVAVSVIVIAVGIAGVLQIRDDPSASSPATDDSEATLPDLATTIPETVPTSIIDEPSDSDAWSPIAPDPRGATSDPAAIWTGSEAIVIGGLDPTGDARSGAVAYSPSTDSWRTVTDSPTTAIEPLVAWTGSSVLMIGGRRADGSDVKSDAYAYDPAMDRWSTVAPPPLSFVTARSSWAWTGTQLLVWPTIDGDPSIVPISYDPNLDAWTELPPAPIAARHSAASVWTETEWIIWGGTDGANEFDDGAAYNPADNTWRTLAESGLAPRRVEAVWTGTEMIVNAGASGGDRETRNGELALADGAAYDPISDSWRAIAPGLAHPGFVPIWTGTDLVMFAKGSAGVYNVADDEWIDTCCSDTGGSVGEAGGTPLWTGANVLLVGSYTDDVGGATFTPPS
jgi:Galactose oxidase, central domain